MDWFAIASTAVLPYSDDGASGEGLQLMCEEGEVASVARAVCFLRLYANTRMFTSGRAEDADVLRARELCTLSEMPISFRGLSVWFREFNDLVESYANGDPHYTNPNQILSLEIRRCRDNLLIFPVGN